MKKNFTKPFYLTLIHLAAVSGISAQEKDSSGHIRGKIIDKVQGPVAYASISLCKNSDSTLIKGSLSTEKGDFSFNKVTAGEYLILVESIGYEKTYRGPYIISSAKPSLTLENIILSPENINLKTVNITATKPLVERKSDKVILNIANSILAAGNSALEILSKAPGVSVDQDGNISLRGRSGVSLMIDNKLTYLSAEQLKNLLRSTDGNDIQTIELMSSPSAKYDASGSAGLINIRLKKNSGYGTNGSIIATGGYGTYHKSNTGINLNHRTKNINIFGNYSYTDNKDFEDLELKRNNVSGNETTYFNQRGKDISGRKNHNYKAGIDYYLNDKNILGFMVSGYLNNNSINSTNETLIGNKPLVTDSSIIGLNPIKSKYSNTAYNINYKSVIDTSGQEFTADADFSKFYSTNEISYNNYYYNSSGILFKTPVIFRTATPADIKIWVGKADYTSPMGSGIKLETGIKSSYVNTDNDFNFESLDQGNWMNDPLQSNRFIYKEYINAAYANLHKEFKSTTLQAGLRAELTHSEGNSPTNGQLLKRQYLDFFPSITINQELDKNHEIGFAYSRRIDRPEYASLNPFIYYADLYTLSQGNPLLNPQYANTYDLSYSYKKTLNVTMGYSHTKDVIATTLLTDSIKKTLTLQDQNLASRNTYSLNANMPVAINSWWNTTNDVTVYYSQFSSANLMGQPFENGKTTFALNHTESFRMSPSVNTELGLNYQSSQAYGTYLAKPIFSTDLGFSKSFLNNKANLKLAVNDLFNTQKIKIRSAIINQEYQLLQKQETRVFRLTFTYNFGSSLIKAVRNRINGSSAEQSRVKSGN